MNFENYETTRDISYSHSANSLLGKAFIKMIENATGRVCLIKRARGYSNELGSEHSFWEVMISRYGLSLDIKTGSLQNIPTNGPLIIIANHPYGILDGLIICYILAITRGNFRILAHHIFLRSEDLSEVILPISFHSTKEAIQLNVRTRREAVKFLSQGGAIGVFPGGTVSTAQTPFSQPLDPRWRSFTAKMIAKSKATVIPVYFEGHTSRIFQIASHLHHTLRMSLLIKEFKNQIDRPVSLSIGKPINLEDIKKLSHNPQNLMKFLRAKTYELSEKPVDSDKFGLDFEQQHRQKITI